MEKIRKCEKKMDVSHLEVEGTLNIPNSHEYNMKITRRDKHSKNERKA